MENRFVYLALALISHCIISAESDNTAQFKSASASHMSAKECLNYQQKSFLKYLTWPWLLNDLQIACNRYRREKDRIVCRWAHEYAQDTQKKITPLLVEDPSNLRLNLGLINRHAKYLCNWCAQLERTRRSSGLERYQMFYDNACGEAYKELPLHRLKQIANLTKPALVVEKPKERGRLPLQLPK